VAVPFGVPFGEPGIQVITLSLSCVAAVLSFASVMLGLLCTVTGKDPLPRRIRRVMRRVPASADDFRLRGMSLMLNGAAVMLLVSLIAVEVVDRLTIGAAFGYAPVASLAFPIDAKFLITTVAAAVAVALFIAAYALSRRVQFVSTRVVTGARSV
jgi:hypothetical protein